VRELDRAYRSVNKIHEQQYTIQRVRASELLPLPQQGSTLGDSSCRNGSGRRPWVGSASTPHRWREGEGEGRGGELQTGGCHLALAAGSMRCRLALGRHSLAAS
jgi:hypothetical protein